MLKLDPHYPYNMFPRLCNVFNMAPSRHKASFQIQNFILSLQKKIKKESIFIIESIFVKLQMKPLPNYVPIPCDGAMFVKLIRVVL